MGKGVNTTIQIIVGNIYKLTKEGMNKTTSNHSNLAKKILVEEISNYVKGKLLTESESAIGSRCTSCLFLSDLESVDNFMRTLSPLTEEQKVGLSKEDQALRELGVITDTLKLSDTSYIVEFLFKTHKTAIATQAIKDVAKIKAELEKEKKA